jgi:hypothetical protein
MGSSRITHRKQMKGVLRSAAGENVSWMCLLCWKPRLSYLAGDRRTIRFAVGCRHSRGVDDNVPSIKQKINKDVETRARV